MLTSIELQLKKSLQALRDEYATLQRSLVRRDIAVPYDVRAKRTAIQKTLKLLVPLHRYLHHYLQPNQYAETRIYWGGRYEQQYEMVYAALRYQHRLRCSAPLFVPEVLNVPMASLGGKGRLLPGPSLMKLWQDLAGEEVQQRQLRNELVRELKQSLQPEQIRMLQALTKMDSSILATSFV
ncbi:1,4-alpha-glucan branching enzyme GlgB [Novimethylophilus kurashikiensis]|uniref:1,4-alpha-glucan branching enzyme GlgB n=1 Tax=Novimethylophilus kurashikiensis TaxID=1825523 RepID=A0A2R5FCV4_9PROT|nr:hypothetical protein [Novimethylophilus kurashikiensis]GBG14474.1 1,4-alpha-glucan branching enzyme GlgB [Novimethylophilus kurashikiensis]